MKTFLGLNRPALELASKLLGQWSQGISAPGGCQEPTSARCCSQFALGQFGVGKLVGCG